jgi:hypothetical protein
VPTGARRAPRARYLPIAEHGLIGDLHTAALVGTDGTIDPPLARPKRETPERRHGRRRTGLSCLGEGG